MMLRIDIIQIQAEYWSLFLVLLCCLKLGLRSALWSLNTFEKKLNVSKVISEILSCSACYCGLNRGELQTTEDSLSTVFKNQKFSSAD